MLPMFLFINEKPAKFDSVYSILFAMLFIPKQLYISYNGNIIGIGEMINAVTICAMIYMIVEENVDRKKL